MAILKYNSQSLKSAVLALILFTSLFSGGGLNPAKAQSATTGTNTTISPPSYELTANPGDVLDEVIKVTNNTANSVTYEGLVEDFRVVGEEGQVTVSEDENPNAFSKWFAVSPSSVQVGPGESKNFRFTIRVPRSAEPGGHFASLLIQPKSIAVEGATGAQILQRVGSLILLTVSGNAEEKGNVDKFYSKSFVGDWETVEYPDGSTRVFAARNEKLEEEKSQGYFSSGPIAFDLVLKNEGNVHYRPSGTVTIYNIFGQKEDEITIDPKNVFPGGQRRITVLWPNKNPYGIRYTAKVVAIYGNKNQTITTETSFWAFPLELAVGILVAIILIVLLRKRIFKAISVIAKG